jgi:hypothetical protein
MYHLYCDESGKHQDHPTIAFSGVCATPSRLHFFEDDWRKLLRSYEISSLHMTTASRLREACGPKMPAGQTIDERIEALLPFADCVNQHLEIGLIQAWDVQGYNSLSLEAKKLLGGSHDPYFLAFIRGMAELAERVNEDDRISVICDDDIQTAWNSYLHYRSVGKADWKIQKKMVALTFANDRYFPGLQAADMVAFLARHEAVRKFYGIANSFQKLFDLLTTDPYPTVGVMKWLVMFADERQLVDFANQMNVLVQSKAK